MDASQSERIAQSVRDILPSCVDFLRQLVQIDTTNPPGRNYPAIARLLTDKLTSLEYEVEQYKLPDSLQKVLAPKGEGLDRINVVGRLNPSLECTQRGPDQNDERPRVLHFNGHMDVVPVGDLADWSVDPFGAKVVGNTIYGRGVSDMKGGIAAQIFAIEAIRKAGFQLLGIVEQSGVVDEETTGVRNAGMGYLVEKGIIAKGKQDAVIITEPLNVENVCCGHRGTIWGRITFHGVSSHGSTPQRGVNALLHASLFIAEAHRKITPLLESRIDERVVPPEARSASLTFTIFNSGTNTNTVPSSATVEFDRRLVPGESLKEARKEIFDLLANLQNEIGTNEAGENLLKWEYEELYATDPVWIGEDEEIVGLLKENIRKVLGLNATQPPGVVCSPGSDDQRFVVKNAGINACVVYGPGDIRNVHNKDESLDIEDLRKATEVMALTAAEFLGIRDIGRNS